MALLHDFKDFVMSGTACGSWVSFLRSEPAFASLLPGVRRCTSVVSPERV